MQTLDEAKKRIEALEKTVIRQAGEIGNLQSAQNIMDKRILEQLRGINSDFENRVVQAMSKHNTTLSNA